MCGKLKLLSRLGDCTAQDSMQSFVIACAPLPMVRMQILIDSGSRINIRIASYQNNAQ